jgi:hypothetical protein
VTSKDVDFTLQAQYEQIQEDSRRRFPILCDRCGTIIGDRYQMSHHPCTSTPLYRRKTETLKTKKKIQQRISELRHINLLIESSEFDELNVDINKLIYFTDGLTLDDDVGEDILPMYKTYRTPFIQMPSIFHWNTYEIVHDSSWKYYRDFPEYRSDLLFHIMNHIY